MSARTNIKANQQLQDHTLIIPKSNKRFSASAFDWKWWDPGVPSKLKQLTIDGYTIVIISNQKAVSLKPDTKAKTGNSDSKSLATLKEKVTAVLDALDLGVSVSIYAATEYDEYRKPRMGMWREIVKDLGLAAEGDADGKEGSTLDLENSIFVGDAAGRKGDHSCCDRYVASPVRALVFHILMECLFLETLLQTLGYRSRLPRSSFGMNHPFPWKLTCSIQRVISLHHHLMGRMSLPPPSQNRVIQRW